MIHAEDTDIKTALLSLSITVTTQPDDYSQRYSHGPLGNNILAIVLVLILTLLTCSILFVLFQASALLWGKRGARRLHGGPGGNAPEECGFP